MMIFAVNTFADISLTKLTGYIKIATGILFLISLITLIIHVIKRNLKTYRLSLGFLFLFLILNLALAIEVIAFEYHKYEMSKIDQMDTCEKAQIQFNKDVDNQSLKYFLFGIGFDEELSDQLENKHDLSVYHMGCMVTPPLECYNELVEQHLQLVELKNSR